MKAPEEITRLDQLKIEKVSFIQKNQVKFRDNYIIGQQMGQGRCLSPVTV